jgi:hypothetical protein
MNIICLHSSPVLLFLSCVQVFLCVFVCLFLYFSIFLDSASIAQRQFSNGASIAHRWRIDCASMAQGQNSDGISIPHRLRSDCVIGCELIAHRRIGYASNCAIKSPHYLTRAKQSRSLRNQCTLDSQSMHTRFTIDVHSIRNRCTLDSQSMHTQFAIDAHSIRNRCTLDSQSMRDRCALNACLLIGLLLGPLIVASLIVNRASYRRARHAILPFLQAAWMGSYPSLHVFDRSAPPGNDHRQAFAIA